MHVQWGLQLRDNEVLSSRLKPVNQFHNVGVWILMDLEKDVALPPDVCAILSDLLDHLDGILLARALTVASIHSAVLPSTQVCGVCVCACACGVFVCEIGTCITGQPKEATCLQQSLSESHRALHCGQQASWKPWSLQCWPPPLSPRQTENRLVSEAST